MQQRNLSKEKIMEVREELYEVYIDDDLYHTGSFEDCNYYFLHALDDDRAEIYKVIITEEKIG
tara:strand:+ start:111 stop:299 length:189 start_codon:yes stop_codon:yes gene_type:complete